jgi:(p)ppGpp synthase/HD superfamily hydrolase
VSSQLGPLVRALAFALQAHAGQRRKGTDAPYASHLLQVAGLVLEHGGDAEQAAAGLLHDVLEDGDAVTREGLAECFGPDVAQIVADCSDTLAGKRSVPKGDWGLRKRAHLARLAAAGPRSALVAACDKRHNLAALVRDLREQGPACLGRFRAGPQEQLWYFGALLEVLGPRIPPRLRGELEELLAELRELLSAESASGPAR